MVITNSTSIFDLSYKLPKSKDMLETWQKSLQSSQFLGKQRGKKEKSKGLSRVRINGLNQRLEDSIRAVAKGCFVWVGNRERGQKKNWDAWGGIAGSMHKPTWVDSRERRRGFVLPVRELHVQQHTWAFCLAANSRRNEAVILLGSAAFMHFLLEAALHFMSIYTWSSCLMLDRCSLFFFCSNFNQ